MSEKYCYLHIDIDDDGQMSVFDDRGHKVKGIRNLDVHCSFDDLTTASIEFLPTTKCEKIGMCRGQVK